MVVDIDPFLEWLRARGTPEPHLEVYRRGVDELARFADVDAAVRAEEAAGASARRIANLREVGARIAEFEASRRARPAPVLDVEPVRRERPTLSPRKEVRPPRKGCSCRDRMDTYIDSDFGVLGKVLGGGIGIGTFILIRLIGLVGALALALALAGTGGFATIFSICFRCEGCRKPIKDLDADERSDLRRARAKVTLVTIALLGGAALCALVWWSAVKARD